MIVSSCAWSLPAKRLVSGKFSGLECSSRHNCSPHSSLFKWHLPRKTSWLLIHVLPLLPDRGPQGSCFQVLGIQTKVLGSWYTDWLQGGYDIWANKQDTQSRTLKRSNTTKIYKSRAWVGQWEEPLWEQVLGLSRSLYNGRINSWGLTSAGPMGYLTWLKSRGEFFDHTRFLEEVSWCAKPSEGWCSQCKWGWTQVRVMYLWLCPCPGILGR